VGEKAEVVVEFDVKGPLSVEGVPLEGRGGKRPRYWLSAKMRGEQSLGAVAILVEKGEAVEAGLRLLEEWQRLAGMEGKRVAARFGMDGEFTAKAWYEGLRRLGVKPYLGVKGDPHAIAGAERWHQTVARLAATYLIAKRVPLEFWPWAVRTASFVLNRGHSKGGKEGVTALEAGTKERASLREMRTPFCKAWVLTSAKERKGMGRKAVMAMLCGPDLRRSRSGEVMIFWDVGAQRYRSARRVDCLFLEGESVERPLLGYGTKPMEEGGDRVPKWMGGDGKWEKKEKEEKGEDHEQKWARAAEVAGGSEDDWEGGIGMKEEKGSEKGRVGEQDEDDTEKEEEEKGGVAAPRTPGEKEPLSGSDSDDEGESAGEGDSSSGGRCDGSGDEANGGMTYAVMNGRLAKSMHWSMREMLNGPHGAEFYEAAKREVWGLADRGMFGRRLTEEEERKVYVGETRFAGKIKEDGSFKVRMVYRDDKDPRPRGEEYEVTTAMLHADSMRMMIAYAASEGLEVMVGDFKQAYTHTKADPKKPRYVRIPTGFGLQDEGRVCLLELALYGETEAGKLWEDGLSGRLEQNGWERGEAERSMFTKALGRKQVRMAVGSHVDDMLAVGKKAEMKRDLERTWNGLEYTWQEGRELKFCGVEIVQGSDGILLHQESFIRGLGEKFGIEVGKGRKAPAIGVLSKEQCPSNEEERAAMAGKPYRSLVCAMRWAVSQTRGDVASEVGALSRYLENPGEAHWKAAVATLRYLLTFPKRGLFYRRGAGIDMVADVDSDWGGADGRSTSGFVSMMAEGPVAIFSRVQDVSLSVAAAETKALSAGMQQVLWQRRVWEELVGRRPGPTVVRIDNTAAKRFAAGGSKTHGMLKHLKIRHAFCEQAMRRKEIALRWTRTEFNGADKHTKSLAGRDFDWALAMNGYVGEGALDQRGRQWWAERKRIRATEAGEVEVAAAEEGQ
jgi:hypothetical protein